jgi:hypothetical protein
MGASRLRSMPYGAKKRKREKNRQKGVAWVRQSVTFGHRKQRDNNKPTKNMTITIFHTESSVDPAATVSADLIDETITNLESQYEAAIIAMYPGAQVNFRREDNTYGHEIDGLDYDAHEDAMREVQDILEQVYEAGDFWI